MNIETLKVLGLILNHSHNQSVRQVLSNLISFTGTPDEISGTVLFGDARPIPAIDEEKEDDEKDTKETHDIRIKWMTFHNLRSIPFIAKNNKPFGINFADEHNNPRSLYLVGRNGTGKTTLYSALEHHYLSDNSLSKSMTLDPKRIMTYGFGEIAYNQPESPSITLETVDKQSYTETLEAHAALCSPASFCSEYDIQQLGTKGKNLFDYMLQQLGYQELNDMMMRLGLIVQDLENQLKSDMKDETADLDASDFDVIVLEVLKRNKNVKQLYPQSYTKSLYDRHYAKFSSGDTPTIFSDYWNRLRRRSQIAGASKEPAQQLAGNENEPTDRANALSGKLRAMYEILENALRQLAIDSSTENLQKVLNQLYEERKSIKGEAEDKLITIEDQERLEGRRQTLMSLMTLIREQRSIIVSDFVNSHFDMLKEIMNFFSNNDCELQKPKVGVETIQIKLLANGEDGSVFRPTPQEYYNSFRYKLYAVSFKIALAFTEMSLKNLRVPIVIDDVFSASDFENNLRLEYFVYNIYEAYDHLNFKEPLQLILLTHDEMVQTAFRRGTDLLVDDEKRKQVRLGKHHYVCGRLYSYKYAVEMSAKTGDEFGFYNLYIKN